MYDAGGAVWAFDDSDSVAYVEVLIVLLDDGNDFAIIQLDNNFQAWLMGGAFLDGRSYDGASNSAGDFGNSLAGAFANGSADGEAEYGSGDGAEAGGGAFDFYGPNVNNFAFVNGVNHLGLMAGIDVAGSG